MLLLYSLLPNHAEYQTLQWRHMRIMSHKASATRLFIPQFVWVKLKETSSQCWWPAARGIHRLAVDTPCRMHIMRKTFLCHDVFMCSYVLTNWVIFASRNGLSPMQCYATAICFLDSQYIKIKLDLFYLTAAVEHIYIFVLCLCQKATLCLTIDDNSYTDSIYLFP